MGQGSVGITLLQASSLDRFIILEVSFGSFRPLGTLSIVSTRQAGRYATFFRDRPPSPAISPSAVA